MEPIIITESAKNKLKKMLSDNSQEAVRFGIKSGGCSGFSYYLEFDTTNAVDDLDEIIEEDNLKIIVDGTSLLYILGTEIDWVEDMMGSHFVFNSPKKESACGCGHSVNFKV